MRWTRTLQTIDVHCAGEIGRVVTGGVLDIPGRTMAEKLNNLTKHDDSLRRLLCSEPRSGPAGSFCLLLPACDPAADVGFIVLGSNSLPLYTYQSWRPGGPISCPAKMSQPFCFSAWVSMVFICSNVMPSESTASAWARSQKAASLGASSLNPRPAR